MLSLSCQRRTCNKTPVSEMHRKIIQIATDAHPQADGGIYALCDDGTVWKLNYLGKTAEWRQIEPVPQNAEGTC